MTNRQVFAFNLNVKFDVFAFTVLFPRVFTMLHLFCLNTPVLAVDAFKAVAEPAVRNRGGVSESETLYA